MYNVSRVTVREAMRQLVDRGIVESRRGYGTVVKTRLPIQKLESDEGATSIKHISGKRTSNKIQAFTRVPATQSLADIFQTEIGAPILHIKRSRHIDENTMSYDAIYIPYSFAQNIDFKHNDLSSLSITQLLRDSGVKIVDIEERFRGALATQDIADQMQIIVGEPMLRAQRYVKVQDPITDELLVAEYSEHYIRTDLGPVVIHTRG